MGSIDYMFLYTSNGSGHEAAARALHNYAQKHSLGSSECIDILTILKSDFFYDFFKVNYRNPISGSVYDLIWESSVGGKISKKAVSLTNRILFLTKTLEAYQPKVIVSTQWFPAQIVSQELWDVTKKQYGVLTDFRANPYWPTKRLSGMFVPSVAAKADLMKFGVVPEKIVVGELSLREDFYTKISKPKNSKTILFIAGGLQKEPYQKIVTKIKPIAKAFQNSGYELEIICGKDEKLKKQLEDWVKEKSLKRIRLTGYVENMAKKMSGAVAIITKPGGLISAEALHLNVPLIYIAENAYVQERKNMDYFINRGMAIGVDSMESFKIILDLLSKDPSLLGLVEENMKKESKYNMPELIFDRILKDD